jgi:hypothetical protein
MIQTPSAAFMIILHALTLVAVLSASSYGPITTIIHFLLILPLLMLSLMMQGFIHAVIAGRNLKNRARVPLYFSPIALFFALYFLGVKPPPESNQLASCVSPSGKYVLEVPIESGSWTLTIRDDVRRVVCRDVNSKCTADVNAYWCWGAADCAWLFNSADNRVYFWEKASEGWKKTEWGYGHTKRIERDVLPPERLYPPYARKKS